MSMMTALLLQAAVAAPDIDFDLRSATARFDCAPGRVDEIVVCGRPDHDRHRLRPLPDAAYAEAPARAEAKLFGDVTGSAVVEAEQFPDGVVSNRIMLKLKVPF
jgi:hypothetical protein